METFVESLPTVWTIKMAAILKEPERLLVLTRPWSCLPPEIRAIITDYAIGGQARNAKIVEQVRISCTLI